MTITLDKYILRNILLWSEIWAGKRGTDWQLISLFEHYYIATATISFYFTVANTVFS